MAVLGRRFPVRQHNRAKIQYAGTTLYSTTLTIVAGKVASDLTNFVVRVNLADMPSGWWSAYNVATNRIAVMYAGLEIPCDITSINTGSSTGVMFFRAPFLATASDNVFQVVIIDDHLQQGAADQNGRNATWSDYAGVIVPSSGDLTNRTGSGGSPTLAGTTGISLTADGLTYSASITGNVKFTGLPTLTQWTMGTRARQNVNNASNRGMLSYSTNSVTDSLRASLLGRSSSGKFSIWNSTDSFLDDPGTSTATELNVWHRWHHTQNGTADRKIWRDGALTATDTTCAQRPTGGDTLFVGTEDNSDAEQWRGDLDLLYLRNGVLSADWLAAEQLSWEGTTFYAVAGPLAVLTTDSENLTDSFIADQFKVAADSEGLTDSTVIDQSEATTDPEGLTDSTAVTQAKGATDDAGLTDSSTVSVGRGVSQTDSEPLTDSVAVDQSKPFTDAEGLTDTQALDQGKVVTDSEGLTDSATVENGRLVTQTDTEALTDTAAVDQTKGISDPLALTDTQSVDQAKVVTDSEGLTDSALVENGKLVSQTDLENLTDSTALSIGQVNTEAAGLTDTQALSQAKVVSDSEGLTDSVSVETGRTVTDAAGMTDSIAIILGAVKVDTATLTDSVAVTFAKILADLVGLTDTTTVDLTGPVTADTNPITLTIRDTGHMATVRAEPAHTTAGSQAATTVEAFRSRLTSKPSTHATTKENR